MYGKLKNLDLTYLETMAEGNAELIKELVDIFRAQVPDFINEMKEHLNNKDWSSLGSIAHKAKSSVYIMGMKALSERLKELEIIAKSGANEEEYPAYVAEFEKECTLAIEELNSLFS